MQNRGAVCECVFFGCVFSVDICVISRKKNILANDIKDSASKIVVLASPVLRQWLFGWLAPWLAAWLPGCLAPRGVPVFLTGWLASSLADCLGGALDGRLGQHFATQKVQGNSGWPKGLGDTLHLEL